MQELKWTEADFAEYDQGKMPMGKPQVEWSYGDVEAGFKNAALVLDETFSVANNQHHMLEPRIGAGLLAERQALHALRHAERRADGGVDLALDEHPEPKDVVLITEYTGGGFGSRRHRLGARA